MNEHKPTGNSGKKEPEHTNPDRAKNGNPLTSWWLPGVVLVGCLAVVYWPIIEGLVHQWLNNQDYSHGPFILPVAAYLAWRKREELQKVGYRHDWRAVSVLLLAMVIYILGELGAELFTTRLSMLVFLVGFVWLLFGLDVIRVLGFPLAFLFLMLPLPGFIYRNVTFPLQLISSRWSVEILQGLGITAFRQGNVIDLYFMVLQVAEACSGLRYIIPLFALGVLFSYFLQNVLWKRIVLILATIPISIVANVFRIAGTGIIGLYWGEEAAQGFFHSFSGWLVFLVCLGLFAVVNLVLKFLPDLSSRKKSDKASDLPDVPSRKGMNWGLVALGAVIVLSTPAVVGSLGDVPPVPLEKELKGFPLTFRGYTGAPQTMDPDIWERVGAQEYILINYEKASAQPVNFYVAYYEYQKKGGDFVHSPRLCLPGAGWSIEENRVRHLAPPDVMEGGLSSLELNELVITRGGARQLVYFWYQGRGRNFTNEFAAKFYMVWDGLFRRRTDGALVRVVMPLSEDQSVEEARKITDPFALAVSEELRGYLP